MEQRLADRESATQVGRMRHLVNRIGFQVIEHTVNEMRHGEALCGSVAPARTSDLDLTAYAETAYIPIRLIKMFTGDCDVQVEEGGIRSAHAVDVSAR